MTSAASQWNGTGYESTWRHLPHMQRGTARARCRSGPRPGHDGYTLENTRLIQADFDNAQQAAKGYA